MLGLNDILVDDDGDLVVGSDGDLSIADTWRTAVQDAVFRIRTELGDYTPNSDIGSNLHSKVGAYNTRENADTMHAMIKRALSYDNRFAPNEYSINIIPVSKSTIVIMVKFPGPFSDLEDTDEVILSFTFNYSEGDIEWIAGPGQSGSGAD